MSVYKVVELIGSSPDSWEKAAAVAIKKASETIRDIRIAEVVMLDTQIENGKIISYRTKLNISFKVEGSDIVS